MRLITRVALLALGLCAGTANADDSIPGPGDGRFYIVGSVGLSYYDTDEINQILDEQAAVYNAILGVSAYARMDEVGFTFSAGAGYQFNSWLALEAFYRGYGNAEPELRASNGTGGYESEAISLKASGFGLGLIASWPVTPAFSLFARIDAVNLKSEAEYSHSSSLDGNFGLSVDDTQVKPAYGMGVQYDYGYGFVVRGEYQRIEAEVELGNQTRSTTIDALSLSVLKAF